MKSILVIEDNKDIRENTAEILDLAGYKIFTAENGKKGVDIAVREKPDVIVCDIMMPELDGYGVLHMLRKNEITEAIPFIFLTAKTERSDFRKGMEMGADDYVTKPFEDIELLNAIEIRLKKAEILGNKYPSSQQGKRPKLLYYVVKGKVKGFKTHEDGKEYITDLFSEGDFIGYPALIEDKNYDDSAVILEDAEIMQIPREDFHKMIFGDLSIAVKFIRIITKNVKDKEERLLNLAYSSLRKRIAKALVDIQEKFNSGGQNKLIEIKEGKIVIANLDKLKNLLY